MSGKLSHLSGEASEDYRKVRSRKGLLACGLFPLQRLPRTRTCSVPPDHVSRRGSGPGMGGIDQDDRLIIPYTTAMKQMSRLSSTFGLPMPGY